MVMVCKEAQAVGSQQVGSADSPHRGVLLLCPLGLFKWPAWRGRFSILLTSSFYK